MRGSRIRRAARRHTLQRHPYRNPLPRKHEGREQGAQARVLDVAHRVVQAAEVHVEPPAVSILRKRWPGVIRARRTRFIFIDHILFNLITPLSLHRNGPVHLLGPYPDVPIERLSLRCTQGGVRWVRLDRKHLPLPLRAPLLATLLVDGEDDVLTISVQGTRNIPELLPKPRIRGILYKNVRGGMLTHKNISYIPSHIHSLGYARRAHVLVHRAAPLIN